MRYYSIQSINGSEPRPDLSPRAPGGSDVDSKLARYEHWSRFTAHSGTYEVNGSRVTTTPIVAKNNSVMTPRGVEQWNVAKDGDALWMTNIAARYRVKLVRLE